MKTCQDKPGSDGFKMSDDEAQRIQVLAGTLTLHRPSLTHPGLATVLDPPRVFWQQCFKEPEFKTLFHEYLDEMSDPKNREEMDTYIRQLEGEGNVPEGMSIPEEGLCAKGWIESTKGTNDGKKSKYFINVTHCPEVDPAKSKTATDPKTGKKGSQWQIPFVISPQPKLVEVSERASERPYPPLPPESPFL